MRTGDRTNAPKPKMVILVICSDTISANPLIRNETRPETRVINGHFWLLCVATAHPQNDHFRRMGMEGLAMRPDAHICRLAGEAWRRGMFATPRVLTDRGPRQPQTDPTKTFTFAIFCSVSAYPVLRFRAPGAKPNRRKTNAFPRFCLLSLI